MRTIFPLFILAVLVVAAIAGRPQPRSIRAIDQQLNVGAFAGSPACAGCHPRESKEFAETPHARALYRAETDHAVKLMAGRSSPNPAPNNPAPARIDFRLKNGRLWAEAAGAAQVEGVPGLPGVPGVPIDWCFGSGQFGVTFVSLLEDTSGRSRLLEHHWSWFQDGDLLALTPGHSIADDAIGFEQFGQVTDSSTVRLCFSCHATTFEYESGRLRSESVMAGVQCESCHGPRKGHVDLKLQTVRAARADTRPKRTARQQVFACGECHRRPDEINDEIRPDNPILARFPSVGLVQSKCFLATESKGTLTCVTCHDPHRAVQPPLSYYNARCNDCHSIERDRSNVPCSLDPMARRAPREPQNPTSAVSEQDNGGCVDCHMPKVRLHDHLRFTDHWIRTTPVDHLRGL